MILRHYPKDNEPGSCGSPTSSLDAMTQHIERCAIGDGSLLCATEAGTPISRNTFRTRVWLPALQRPARFHVRWHDLRHTHASWLLAGGADLKTVMDRLGHSQLSTTQRYLHTLPDKDDTALAALARIRSAPGS